VARLALLRRAAAAVPPSACACELAALSNALVRAGQGQAALDAARQATELAPGLAVNRMQLARAALAAGDFATAETALRAAEAQAPGLAGLDQIAAELKRRTGPVAR
jgi:Flp pilus assembly protein TadD